MKKVPLSKGMVALVDDEDYERVMQFKWHGSKHSALRTCCKGRRKTIHMHRFIINAPAGKMVDHINGNPMDNRKANLRICTRAENVRNQKRHSNNTSGYRGVCYRAQSDRWQAHIAADGRKRHLGFFDSAKEAAKAYDEAARKLHGSFARLNFPRKGERKA